MKIKDFKQFDAFFKEAKETGKLKAKSRRAVKILVFKTFIETVWSFEVTELNRDKFLKLSDHLSKYNLKQKP